MESALGSAEHGREAVVEVEGEEWQPVGTLSITWLACVTHPAEVEKGPGFLLNDLRKHDGRTRPGLTSDTSEGS